LHDPLTVACLVAPGFVTVERLPVLVAVEDGLVTTTVDPVAGRDADVVTDVDADGFVAHWLDVVTG
jgi:inosine-uridine nucleoside N-ribohydrolase